MKLSGVVTENTGRGKELGFPTANIKLSEVVEDGVYLGFTTVKKQRLPSLIFIGTPKMFGETIPRAESYILDFDKNLYGQTIEIEIIKKLRPSKDFDSKDQLIAQMNQDEIYARNYFKNNV